MYCQLPERDMRRYLFLLPAALYSCSSFALAYLGTNNVQASQLIIVDHLCTRLADIPSEWIGAAKNNLHIAYGHTSHGSQLITGMTGLVSFKGSLYAFNNGGTGGALDLKDTPFSGASDLGNPDFTTWEPSTRTYLASHTTINVVIWSWCGQVSSASEANINTYLNLMSGLERDFPGVKFVYMTGHLDGTGATGNLNVRNEQIRAYCRNNNKILFDFTDIESYDPDGLVHYMPLKANDNCDYDSDGNGSLDKNWALLWQNSHTQGVDWYNCSPAHTQALNGNLKAYAAWYLWARLAGWQETALPSAPSITDAATQATNQLKLTWGVVSAATSYNVYRGTSAFFTPDRASGANRIGFHVIDQDAGTTGIQWTDASSTAGDCGINCCYVVTAVNASGESGNSNRFAEFDYSLITTPSTDFNEIALPLNQSGITNAQQLMTDVPNCNSVARWNPFTQGYEQYVPGLSFTNFSVQMGYPYYVNVTSGSIFSMSGEPASPTFNLVTTATTDFNEIMLAMNKTSITKASGLMGDIPNCNSVAVWNAASQGYSQFVPGLSFTDFDVRLGYPYYVNVTANGTWPSGGIPKTSVHERLAAAIMGRGHVPHAVWGSAPERIRFRTFISTRPDEVLTEVSPGNAIRDGYVLIQCAGFTSAWKPGETLVVELESQKGNPTGRAEIILTAEPSDKIEEFASSGSGIQPEAYKLDQNYPNPFNPETMIRYSLAKAGFVRLSIYNLSGQEIRTLVNDTKQAGSHESTWDGKNDSGQPVPSGLYFYHLHSGLVEKKMKAILVR